MIEPAEPMLNILTAWPYCKGELLRQLVDLGPRCRFLLDSGAFTAFKAKKVLLLDDYCRYIETLPLAPWRYFALDVIGDPHATMQNYRTMLARGFKPVPVFTRGEDASVLDEYFETSDCVGLGGVAGADNAAYAWTKWAMNHVAGRQVHILGFTNMDWVKFLAPYSVDSSSWNGFGRYGNMDVYLGQGRFARLDRKTAAKKLGEPAVNAALIRMGFDPMDLRLKESWASDYTLCAKVAAASWVACSADVRRSLNTHLFLASNTDWQITNLREGFERLQGACHPALRPRPSKGD